MGFFKESRKSNADEQMALAQLFDGTIAGLPGGTPAPLVTHAAYAPFEGTDALAVLLQKNIFADFGADGYARGWKWESYLYAQFSKNEPPPKIS